MDGVTTIFFDENSTLRSGWRIAIFFISYFVFFLIVSESSPELFKQSEEGHITVFSKLTVIMMIGALAIGSLCGKLFEKLPFHEIGLRISWQSLRNLFAGSFIGAAVFTLAVAITMVFGNLSFSVNPTSTEGLQSSALTMLVYLGIAAASEEAVFRGYIFQTLTRSGYAWLAIGITSAFFGIAHLNNPDAGVISTLNTILAGVWFGLAYLKTRDLWFVWGVHWFWNWTQGSVFGIEVSGLTDLSAGSLLVENDLGPHWLTGTTYGIEGGIACTIAILASIVAIQYGKFATDNTDKTDMN